MLTSLEGSPESVGGDFSCSNNQLTSLEGSPISIGGDFYCFYNQLTSLEGCPISIGGDFGCSHNQLTSLKGCQSEINGRLHCDNNKLKTLRYFPNVKLGIDIYENPLPDEIDDNVEYLKDIIKYQYEYGIWNKNDTLNIARFNLMMEEIKDNK